MSRLPKCEYALIEDSKLVDYSLNPHSERGQHKARVFETALGFNLSNWELLKQAIYSALPEHDATLVSETEFGKKYQVILSIVGPNARRAEVITIWQFDRFPDKTFKDVPRLVTAYIP